MERGIKLPQSPSEWGFKGENYLLIIGIDKYTHWKPLQNAVKDVNDISKLLTERYQFEPDKVMTLFNEEATEDNIRGKLMHVKRTITPDDNLVVFYSGHGHYDADLDEGYWVPANARKNNPSDYISNSDVLKWIRSIKTHHTLMLVDSCFSGTLVSQSRSEVLSEKYPSSRIFASGRKELVDDGLPGTNSPFAKAILSRLTYNTDRVMRASELIQNVTRTVEAQGGQAPIEGRIKDGGDEGGEFVFHLKITEEEIWNAVVSASAATEYTKYLEYFPDGRYALTARTKISELTDEDDWLRAMELSSSPSYTQYLEAHPRGAHIEEALRRLDELEENDAWQLAKTRGTVSSYMDYLRKYPSGRFDAIARKNLDTLKQSMKQHEQDLVQDELEVIVVKSDQTQDHKEQYKNLINEAEGLYAQMAYEKSIVKYEAALQLFQSHYIPNKTFVIQRIDLAKRRLRYVEFHTDGEAAMKAGNFDLALEFFKKAQSFDDTGQVRNSIQVAQRKGVTIGPPPTPVRISKKKSSGVSPVFWILGFLVLGIIGYVVYAVIDSANSLKKWDDYSNPSYDVPSTTPESYTPIDNSAGEETGTEPVYESPALPSDVIWGRWNVTGDNQYSATWTFRDDGIFIDDGTYSGSGDWEVKGYLLTITVPDMFVLVGAPLSSVSKNYMQCSYVEYINYISYPRVLHFNRSN